MSSSQEEERYSEIKRCIEYCKVEKIEFLQIEFYKKKDFIWVALGVTAIITAGLFSVLEDTNILISIIYSLPHTIISITAIKAYWKARKEKFAEYKSLKRYSVW
ncbi:hypothetical protein [uncultured Clostridium sp.]|uniref:hypothetical protein n=1 Tax=uncultured Clostridium sp. TaxID=59620 RepID=UPI00261DE135|nr:hypothetical protein [uncultured Clostridium sp.]